MFSPGWESLQVHTFSHMWFHPWVPAGSPQKNVATVAVLYHSWGPVFTDFRTAWGSQRSTVPSICALSAFPERLELSLLFWMEDVLLIIYLSEKSSGSWLRFSTCASSATWSSIWRISWFCQTDQMSTSDVDETGIKVYPCWLHGIRPMTPSKLKSHYQQFVCAMQRLQSAVHSF